MTAQPVARAPELAPEEGPLSAAMRELRRRTNLPRLSRWALEQCWGARLGVWLARLAALPLAVSSFYLTRPLGDVLDAVLRVACLLFSWCAGLAALSAAGPAHARKLDELEGLLMARALPVRVLREQPAAGVAAWTWRHMTPLALLVASASALGPEPWRPGQLAGLAVGVGAYFLALGALLALLVHLCQLVSRARGQSLLLLLVFAPEVLAPAWPELTTIPRACAALLDACLALGARW